ncbi:plasmid replication protein, CyRepA1 family [Paraburkholderia sp. J41]|uniref:plasmid replication protein, CyRepA1 family n=1 Tax=Paraburkholderia sp. J41 TaxID=2805433 RepID=UPI002AC356E1|nr:plasmid replication protein, CyRepA1 family [Paraburkholderia sp. J41]
MDNYYFYVNNYTPTGRSIEIYQSKNHLTKDMLDTMRGNGGKHYVACNSKADAENFAEMIRVETGLHVMCITSTNSQDPEIKDFINNIVDRVRDYDVLVASPSLGTGIDITFSKDEQWIDCVWGYFSDKINTHFDMDQQLCRVRHPKQVKAWVAESSLQYETEPSAIKRVIVDLDELPAAIRGYGPHGMPVIDDDDPLLHVYAYAVSMQNASKNDLRGNFIKLKERNGWEIKHVAPPKADRGSSGESGVNVAMQAAEARKRLEEMHAKEICDAEPLTEEEYKALNDAMMLTSDEQLRRDRYAIEKFYGQEITLKLVLMDNRGRYRTQINAMCELLESEAVALTRTYGNVKAHALDKDMAAKRQTVLKDVLMASAIYDGKRAFDTSHKLHKDNMRGFVDCCLDYRAQLAHLFDMALRKDIEDKPMFQFKEFLDLIGLDTATDGKSDAGGKRTHFYRLDPNLLERTMGFAKYRLKTRARPAVQSYIGTPYVLNAEGEKVYLSVPTFEE